MPPSAATGGMAGKRHEHEGEQEEMPEHSVDGRHALAIGPKHDQPEKPQISSEKKPRTVPSGRPNGWRISFAGSVGVVFDATGVSLMTNPRVYY
ncbi:MAG: hypothetical protein U0798_06405 [Gemmataceae bacterium]